MRKILFALMLASVAGARPQGSGAPVKRFEVASVKPSAAAPAGGARSAPNDPTLFSARNSTLKQLVQRAYDLPDYLVEGGPGWAESVRYDVEAKSSLPAATEEMQSMLRALLADRFGLVLRHETKMRLMNVLTVAPGGPHFGPQFQRLSSDAALPVRAPAVDEIRFPNVTMKTFCRYLQLNLRRNLAGGKLADAADIPPVLDQTEISGNFDIVLNTKSEEDWGEILKRQLGLRLDQRRVAITVTTIQAATVPPAN